MNKKTKILRADNDHDIAQAISLIQEGKIVAVPTETVYGLAADARNVQAVQQIFIIKNRPTYHPLIVHIASFQDLAQWAKDIPATAAILAEHFWPGPLTLLLNKKDDVNDVITGGLQTIALRVPQNRALLKILRELKTGLAAPSANPHKRISPTSAEHVLSGLSGKIDAVLDDGPCQIGVESTIVDLTTSDIKILRHGPITKKMIEDALQICIGSPFQHAQHVPGNMKSHYQPYTKTLLMDIQAIENQLELPENKLKKFGVIHYSDFISAHQNVTAVKLSKNKAEYSKSIYQALHELDVLNVDKILVETPPHDDAWHDILDRLTKACAVENE
jgi:L-threonylcarbamoyladenylate synthase